MELEQNSVPRSPGVHQQFKQMLWKQLQQLHESTGSATHETRGVSRGAKNEDTAPVADSEDLKSDCRLSRERLREAVHAAGRIMSKLEVCDDPSDTQEKPDNAFTSGDAEGCYRKSHIVSSPNKPSRGMHCDACCAETSKSGKRRSLESEVANARKAALVVNPSVKQAQPAPPIQIRGSSFRRRPASSRRCEVGESASVRPYTSSSSASHAGQEMPLARHRSAAVGMAFDEAELDGLQNSTPAPRPHRLVTKRHTIAIPTGITRVSVAGISEAAAAAANEIEAERMSSQHGFDNSTRRRSTLKPWRPADRKLTTRHAVASLDCSKLPEVPGLRTDTPRVPVDGLIRQHTPRPPSQAFAGKDMPHPNDSAGATKGLGTPNSTLRRISTEGIDLPAYPLDSSLKAYKSIARRVRRDPSLLQIIAKVHEERVTESAGPSMQTTKLFVE